MLIKTCPIQCKCNYKEQLKKITQHKNIYISDNIFPSGGQVQCSPYSERIRWCLVDKVIYGRPLKTLCTR